MMSFAMRGRDRDHMTNSRGAMGARGFTVRAEVKLMYNAALTIQLVAACYSNRAYQHVTRPYQSTES